MPTFNYTSGNTANLTGGGPASMTDIQGPFTDLRSAVNGNLDETNVPNLAAAFTTYKHIVRGVAQLTSAAGVGSYVLSPTQLVATNASAVTSIVHALIYLDPTHFNANARTTKLALRLTVFPNAVAPAITFTAGLYPPATYAGASGAGPGVASLGTVVSGSTAAVASPPALTATTVVSSDFNFPAAGMYEMVVNIPGGPAAGSVCDLIAQLEMRQV